MRISQFLDRRSPGDCVQFFYQTQKLDEFAVVRRKMTLKKRRMQVRSEAAPPRLLPAVAVLSRCAAVRSGCALCVSVLCSQPLMQQPCLPSTQRSLFVSSGAPLLCYLNGSTAHRPAASSGRNQQADAPPWERRFAAALHAIRVFELWQPKLLGAAAAPGRLPGVPAPGRVIRKDPSTHPAAPGGGAADGVEGAAADVHGDALGRSRFPGPRRRRRPRSCRWHPSPFCATAHYPISS